MKPTIASPVTPIATNTPNITTQTSRVLKSASRPSLVMDQAFPKKSDSKGKLTTRIHGRGDGARRAEVALGFHGGEVASGKHGGDSLRAGVLHVRFRRGRDLGRKKGCTTPVRTRQEKCFKRRL